LKNDKGVRTGNRGPHEIYCFDSHPAGFDIVSTRRLVKTFVYVTEQLVSSYPRHNRTNALKFVKMWCRKVVYVNKSFFKHIFIGAT